MTDRAIEQRGVQWDITIHAIRAQMQFCHTALGAACTVLEESSEEYELADNKAYCNACRVLGVLEMSIESINEYINKQPSLTDNNLKI